jgi:hypothetical protein
MHRCLPSLGTRSGRPPPLTTGATSTMREHETTDLFGSYLEEARRHPPLTRQGEIEQPQADEARLPGLTIAGAAA